MKLRILKTLLWFLSGTGLMVILMRIIHGPGSVVALTDIIPWGLWKGFGVVALVPIGGAGFTLAAFVYIFHWNRYKPLARGAVLLGLVCYSSVAAGLTFDIGIWWRIVYPLVFWQFHSTLFEIAWCIMLYLGVLLVEFSHAVVERFNFPRLLSVIKKVSIVFVIAGISLSTLHQSSLGTLFLATPYRLHPLWHTDLLPFLFFITAIGLGCLTITWVTLVVHWLYGAKHPMDSISGLGRIAAIVFAFFLVLRLAEIGIAGEGARLFAPGWNTVNFWLEMLLGALIPAALLLVKKYRNSPVAMFWISLSAILGISLNRVNVAGLATLSATQTSYLPIWPEWAVTLGILSLAGLGFLFCVERFKVYESIDREVVDRAYSAGRVDHADWKTFFFHNPLAEVRLYSMAFVLAAGVAFGWLPDDSVFGVSPRATPVLASRTVQVGETGNPGASAFVIANPGGQNQRPVLMLDGNRNGDYVLFDHRNHQEKTRDQGITCQSCHHMNKPYDQASACHECHRDMYLVVDIFDHGLHQTKLGGNRGCVRCHRDPALPKLRENTTRCEECHRNMRPEGTLVNVSDPARRNRAVGYMEAMHGQCIGCHKKRDQEHAQRCTNCHRDLPRLEERAWQSRL